MKKFQNKTGPERLNKQKKLENLVYIYQICLSYRIRMDFDLIEFSNLFFHS